MEWAFGEFWDMMDVRLVNLSFSNHHPELPLMDGKMTIEEGLAMAAKHWLELQKETVTNG
jgi:hypothetical protein